jgi:hypothetical protein
VQFVAKNIRENSCNSWQKEIRAIRGRVTDMTNIVVIGMGYVGIPCAALLADVPGFSVTGIQRRSERAGWKIDCLPGR